MSVVHLHEFLRKYNEFKLLEKLKFRKEGKNGYSLFLVPYTVLQPKYKANNVQEKEFWGKNKTTNPENSIHSYYHYYQHYYDRGGF